MIQVDRKTIIQIFGGLMSNPNLLSDVDKILLEPTDFSQQLDKYIFSAIYNLYLGGAENIHTTDIIDYLSGNNSAKDLIEKNNGVIFLQDCENYSDSQNFLFYYKKLKKINLLRDLQKNGRDISKFYCDNPLDPDYDKINTKFEEMTIDEILNSLKGELAGYESKYSSNSVVEESKAVNGVRDLIKTLKITPEAGVRLQGDMFNTVCRGGRKGKLYLRSASSGVGKTRGMVGDACNIAYPLRFDNKFNQWIPTGTPEKVLYIMTEQDPAEIQTMILAYLTGYNEELFLYGNYTSEHMDRIEKAIQIMEEYQDNMLFARIPDPCSSVIKNLFRKYNLQEGVENFFYDYIFSSPAMLEEYRDLKIREDVALRLVATTLKNLAIELNSFVMTATQLSGDDDPKGGFKDFRNIRGSKAIADLADFACIRRRPSSEELKLVSGFEKLYNYNPNMITDIFKNRRGRWTMISIWSAVDLGTLRTVDLFVTTPDYKPIEDFQIVEFIEEDTNKLFKITDKYNGNLERTTEVKKFELPDDITSEFEEVSKAFGDEKDIKQRFKDVSLGDLV